MSLISVFSWRFFAKRNKQKLVKKTYPKNRRKVKNSPRPMSELFVVYFSVSLFYFLFFISYFLHVLSSNYQSSRLCWARAVISYFPRPDVMIGMLLDEMKKIKTKKKEVKRIQDQLMTGKEPKDKPSVSFPISWSHNKCVSQQGNHEEKGFLGQSHGH